MRKAYSYIRMSTDTQLKGDSLRRQLEASASYAKAHDLELIDSLDGRALRDIGVSGYRGLNAQKGVLGHFLVALEEGRIEKDAVLLVESLDRLSRDKLIGALTQFTSILDAGIEIITLADNQRYTKEIINQNYGAIFVSLGIMLRANEESETKSKRLQAVWQNKRSKASETPLTSVCPGWLTYSRDEKKFLAIPERVEVVRTIFSMCANTTGLYGIARFLNEEKIETFGRSTAWHRSYVAKIIANRAVLGTYQPHKKTEGKLVPYGEPVDNYYPAIITEEQYHLAQAAINRRSQNNRGRKGSAFSNIFSGLLYCGSCGAKMIYRNRGKPPKGGKYLICSRQNLRAGCQMPEWRLDDFTETLLKHLRDVDFSNLNDESGKKRKSLSEEIEVLNQKLARATQDLDRRLDFFIKDDLNQEVKIRLERAINDLGEEISGLKRERELKTRQLDEHGKAEKMMNVSAMTDLIQQLASEDENYLLRSAVNQALCKAIERIELQIEPFVFMPYEYEESDEEVISYRSTFDKRRNLSLRELVLRPSFKEHCTLRSRRLVVRYKNSAVRHVQFGSGLSFKFSRTFRKN